MYFVCVCVRVYVAINKSYVRCCTFVLAYAKYNQLQNAYIHTHVHTCKRMYVSNGAQNLFDGITLLRKVRRKWLTQGNLCKYVCALLINFRA